RSVFFHGIINKKRSQLSIHGVFVDGDWNTDSEVVKDVFKDYFATRFKQPAHGLLKLNISFLNRLSTDQVADMDRSGSNSSFIALIPKVTDAKFVTDFRPISLTGCVYKVVTKILANRLATVISDLVSDIQSAFVANRQILDGSFILNELLALCKRKKKQAMIFKVDFAKAYDSVCWDYLLDVLQAFGFGPNWCKATSDGLFKCIQIQGSMVISHLFYADDAVFIGECFDSNLDNIVKILKCFFLASGLKINIQKSQVLGVGVPRNIVNGSFIDWIIYVPGYPSGRLKLSIGGRLTLLKSVLGASPLYNMSTYKVPKGVLKEMEAIRCNFFNGADPAERKITWVSWDKVLVSKKNGGLGVSSFHALNRALLLKWVWRFLSQYVSLCSTTIGVGSLSAPTILQVLSITRNPEICQHYNLCKMSDNTTKAQCKHCFHFFSQISNSTLKNHITHPHCEALKTVLEVGQSSMSRDGSVFVYNPDVLREQFAECLIEWISTDLEFFDDGFATKAKERFNDSFQDFEAEILEEEVLEHEAIALSDEEVALDEAVSEARSSEGEEYMI
nr:RNA-directed DNA polymerase, eukaryota [Tanacetum cinerariifolium]